MSVPFEIAVLLPTRSFGGHERMLLTWLQRVIHSPSAAVRLYTADVPALLREAAQRGFPPPDICYRIESGSRMRRLLADLLATWRAARSVRANGLVLLAPGVVQTQWTHALVAAAAGAKVACYVPMAFPSKTMRFRWPSVRDRVVRAAVRCVSLWITITNRQRELLSRYWKVSEGVLVVPNAISSLGVQQRPHSGTARAGSRLRVAYVGRFDANQKGLDWLTDAMRRNPERWQGRMSFRFQGDGEFASALKATATLLGSDCVQVLPWGDPAALLSDADVVILPSRFEGLPLIALEAVDAGVPLLATREAGLEDLILPEHQFEFGDTVGLFAALDRMLEPAERTRALAAARDAQRRLADPRVFERAVDHALRQLEALSRKEAPWK